MAATALEIEKNPKFQELVATRKSLGWTLSHLDAGDLFRLHPARRLRPAFLGTPFRGPASPRSAFRSASP